MKLADGAAQAADDAANNEATVADDGAREEGDAAQAADAAAHD